MRLNSVSFIHTHQRLTVVGSKPLFRQLAVTKDYFWIQTKKFELLKLIGLSQKDKMKKKILKKFLTENENLRN